MKQLLLDALKGCVADYAEICFEATDSTSFSYQGENLENAGTLCGVSGMVRACVKGGWGTCTFDTLDHLKEKVASACADAALVGNEKTILADCVVVPELLAPATFLHDFRGVSLDEKIRQLKIYNDIILKSGSAVKSSNVSYMEKFRRVYFVSTRGDYHMKEIPRVVLRLTAFARKGDQVQPATESFSSLNDYDVILNRENVALEVAERANALLSAPKCEGGRSTVILRPDFAGVFIHEAFGHLSEADFLYENPQMRDLMKIGRSVGTEKLNVFDDGTISGKLGSMPLDDEGVPMQKTQLIRKGELVGHLHSRETAGKMGAEVTGNARRISASKEPIVRMTNTYIAPGESTKEELFSGVDDGIYACGAFGGQTMMEMFTFSAAYAYRIRKGKKAELIRDVVLSGNVFETMHNIDAVANDFELRNTGGGCGKGGQFPLPVTCGAPHIRLRDVLIGGN